MRIFPAEFSAVCVWHALASCIFKIAVFDVFCDKPLRDIGKDDAGCDIRAVFTGDGVCDLLERFHNVYGVGRAVACCRYY